MWKNKHVVVALLVAPLLSILAWFAVGNFVGEEPKVAEPGAVYKLIARSNCRYDSGECDLVNNEFKVTLLPVQVLPGVTELTLDSEFALDQATIALVVDDVETPGIAAPRDFQKPTKAWTVTIPATVVHGAHLRVAVSAQESLYYIEAPVAFMLDPPERP